MPARPRPRDIVVYNAWADRMGQPRWGADDAAAPAAAPAQRRPGRPGMPRPESNAYGSVEPAADGNWQRGTYWVNRTEWALTAAGVPRKLRTWNSRTGQYTWFPAGRDYYDNNRQRFIINVPCVGYIHPDDVDGEPGGASVAGGLDIDEDNVDITPLMRMSVWGQGNYTRNIPLIPDGEAEYRRPTRAGRDSNLGLVRDQDYAQQDIEEALRRSIPDILRSYPQIMTRDGLKHVIAIESKVIWVWDEDAVITFDEQIFRHVYSQEVPLIETLLDRPLLGLPYIDELMYGRQGLSKLASLDLTDRGGCVVAQIYELAETEKKLS